MKHVKLFEGFLNEAGNIGIMHKDAAKERHAKWQKENKDTVIKVGDIVKKEFVQGKDTEHMWVGITKVIDKDHFEGTLDQDPLVIDFVKNGDKVLVNKADIEQLYVEK
jgi:uncharacterized protein YegJ (DUF2314 family)